MTRFALSDGSVAESEDVYASEDFYLTLDTDELVDLTTSPAFGDLAQRELDARYAMGI